MVITHKFSFFVNWSSHNNYKIKSEDQMVRQNGVLRLIYLSFHEFVITYYYNFFRTMSFNHGRDNWNSSDEYNGGQDWSGEIGFQSSKRQADVWTPNQAMSLGKLLLSDVVSEPDSTKLVRRLGQISLDTLYQSKIISQIQSIVTLSLML